MCKTLKVSRSGYHKWCKRIVPSQELSDRALSKLIKECYEEHNGTPGYRMITDLINDNYEQDYKEKKVLRIMRILGIQSITRRKRKKYPKVDAEITAENILDRNFGATAPNQKWVTDVTEFKTSDGKKIYLSAILDLYDRSIVAYIIRNRNDNILVFETFDLAIKNNEVDGLIFHSDRGYQYTSPTFKHKLESNNIIQSMSRPGYCIDNGPIEGFWGILKSEVYYHQNYESKEDLVRAIENYISFYNSGRPQRRFNKKTPLQVRKEAFLTSDEITQYPIPRNNKTIKYFESFNKSKEQYAII